MNYFDGPAIAVFGLFEIEEDVPAATEDIVSCPFSKLYDSLNFKFSFENAASVVSLSPVRLWPAFYTPSSSSMRGDY
jgi:hypothetical protein